MKKYIFIDIDGTLTDSNRKVSENNIKAMNNIEEKGFEVIFCSGRNNDYLINIANNCNTSRYIISSNGSMIFDNKEKKVIHKNQIPFEILKKIYDYCEENEVAITFNTDECRYFNKFFYKDKKDIKIIDNYEDLNNKIITQFVVGSYNYNQMLEVKEFLDKIEELEIVNISTTMKLKQKESTNGFFYDVVLKGINKGTGITTFSNIMNTTKDNLIAIGDHVNDIDMFNSVGYKIAMGNAYDELKNKANFITKTNDEDGVMYALEHIEKEFL